MNAERLLQHYERIADAPDAIARLRRFILDLAVRGKLMPQDANDEPASELLKRIAKEKARLVKSGEIKGKPLPPVGGDADFEIPPTWQWTRLGTVTSYIQRGKSPKYAASDGSLVVSQKCVQWSGLDLSVAKQITLESLGDYEDIRFLRDGDLLWNSTGTGTIGRIIRLVDPPEKLVCDSHVTVVRCLEVEPEYIRTWLRSDHVYALIEDRAAGSTNQVELTAQMAINQMVPLPPLAEQRRIVAKVDELMGLCDRLEAAREGREAVRDRLAAASLARLNAPDPETFQSDARFALDALPALTSRADQIKQLRQTILNLAVRGKLVPQDAKDEPASELLKQLKKAQVAASASEGLRSRPPIEKLGRADLWFEFPESWELSCFDDLFVIVSGVTKGQKVAANEAVEVPYLRVANVQRGHLDLTVIKNITVRTADRVRYALRRGDILMTEGGDWDKLGRAAIWHEEILGCIHQNHVFRVRPPSNDICPEWVTTYANSLLGRSFFEDASKQTTNLASINMTQLRGCPIPLPPLAEQHRIVAKVDALRALCDRLEASLAATAVTRRRLLDALLAEALAPSEDRDAFFDASPDAKPVPTFAGHASEAAE
jgi:type I restriction enzyme S subunit